MEEQKPVNTARLEVYYPVQNKTVIFSSRSREEQLKVEQDIIAKTVAAIRKERKESLMKWMGGAEAEEEEAKQKE
jgi:hypothetical protein